MKSVLPLPIYLLFVFILSDVPISSAQNQPPQISNLQASGKTGSSEITITYDLSDAEGDDVEINVLVSGNGGETFLIPVENISGDIGFPVSPGTEKEIIWNYDLNPDVTAYRLKLVADDRREVDIQEIVDQVDSNRLKASLQSIAGERHRTTDPDHLAAVKDSLTNRFEAYGLQTERQAFDYGTGYTAHNINGRLQGQKREQITYIVDAHFDAVPNSPGADDNGSGVAGVMEAARILSEYHFDHSIRFIGFDLEEAGLVGSNRYVYEGGIKSYDSVSGVFNFEMIGYYSDQPNSQNFPFGFEILFPEAYAQAEADTFQGDFITNVANVESEELKTSFDSAAARYVPELEVISLSVQGNGGSTPDLRRSDHANFWDAGYQALMLTDGANFRNSNYHQPTDEVGTIDFDFMRKVVQATVGAICEKAGIQHSSIVVTEIETQTSCDCPNATNPNLELFPNPTQSTVQIHTDAFEQEVQIRMMDMHGRMLMEDKRRSSPSGTWEIDLRSITPGLYFLEVTDGRDVARNKLIIEQ